MLYSALSTPGQGVDRPRVLVVDDEPGVAETVADILDQGGFEANAMTDPVEALRMSAGTHYEVALLDLAMPRMSGLDLAERLHERSPDTQVIILTGRTDVESAVGGLHVGVFDYLFKGAMSADFNFNY